MLSVTQDLDFVFQLPPVPKADTEKISKFGRETDGRNVDEFITQVERTIHAQKLGQEHYEHKVNVVMNNVSVTRQAEITAYRDSCTIEWAGRIPHDAWEKFKRWFVKTNADVLRFDKAEQDYAIISQGPKEAIADYHVRFSRARNRAAANGVAKDTDASAKSKLLYSYRPHLQTLLKEMYTDKELRRNWTLQQMRDSVIEACAIKKVYQQTTMASSSTPGEDVALIADTVEKRRTFMQEGRCFQCGGKDHVAKHCPNKPKGKAGKGKRKAQANAASASQRKATKKSKGGSAHDDKQDANVATTNTSAQNKKIAKLEKQGKLMASYVAKLDASRKSSTPASSRVSEDTEAEPLNGAGVEKSAPLRTKKLQAALTYFGAK